MLENNCIAVNGRGGNLSFMKVGKYDQKIKCRKGHQRNFIEER